MVGIACMSPWSNSSGWLKTAKPFQVRIKSVPTIQLSYSKTTWEFRKGKENHLECFATGEPSPIVTWYDPLGQVIDNSRYFVGSQEEVNLKFDANQEITVGSYTCTATNTEGNDTVVFNVELEDDLVIARDVVLGSGQFGKVYRGFYLGEAVAVKTTLSNTDVTLFKEFLKEAKTMAFVGEQCSLSMRIAHIIHFCGAMIEKIRERILYVVVELSPFGNLHSYLRKECKKLFDGKDVSGEARQIWIEKLNLFPSWAWQIADGMEFLGSKKLVHGDLATRNVLLFKNNIVKISDFGLSSRLYGYQLYVKKKKSPLPWAWMSVEALRYLQFSTQSDVWAFGITIHEIFSLGQIPYPGMRWTHDFVDKLNKGLRVQQPELASKKVYDIILRCCEGTLEMRPSFGVIKDLWSLLKKNENSVESDESPNAGETVHTPYTDLDPEDIV